MWDLPIGFLVPQHIECDLQYATGSGYDGLAVAAFDDSFPEKDVQFVTVRPPDRLSRFDQGPGGRRPVGQRLTQAQSEPGGANELVEAEAQFRQPASAVQESKERDLFRYL